MVAVFLPGVVTETKFGAWSPDDNLTHTQRRLLGMGEAHDSEAEAAVFAFFLKNRMLGGPLWAGRSPDGHEVPSWGYWLCPLWGPVDGYLVCDVTIVARAYRILLSSQF